jgi:hypothetical protein
MAFAFEQARNLEKRKPAAVGREIRIKTDA